MIRSIAIWCFVRLPVDVQFACAARWVNENGWDMKKRKPLAPVTQIRARRR
jgi:hypothetical protein